MRRSVLVVSASLALSLAAGCGTGGEVAVRDSSPTATASVAAPASQSLTPPPSTTVSHGDDALLRNKLYATGRVAAAPCSLPTKRLSTKAAITRYTQALVACLDRSWRSIVERSGNYFESPKLQLVDSEGSSPCTGPEGNAFYCGENLTIYLRWNSFAHPDRDQTPVRMEVLDVMAHEYGHHIQQLTGILGYYDSRVEGLSDKAAWPDTRRMELQATCLGAAYLGANRRTLNLTGDRLLFLRLLHEEGDEEPPFDHGSPESNEAWTTAAFASANPKSCNTWTAPAAKVS